MVGMVSFLATLAGRIDTLDTRIGNLSEHVATKADLANMKFKLYAAIASVGAVFKAIDYWIGP